MAWRRWIFPVLALALGLLLSEGLCRLLFASPFAVRSIAPGMLYHPRWGVIHEPGSSYRSRNPAEGSDFGMQINSLGFRGPELIEPRGDRSRFVFVGDSFTEGYGVEVQDGLVAQTEQRFRENGLGDEVELVNAGIRGGAPWTYRVQLDRTLSLDPDGVVLVAYDNDLADDFYYSVDWDQLRAGVYGRIAGLPFESRLLEMVAELWVRAKRRWAVARAEALVGGPELRAPSYVFGSGRIQEDPLGFYADPEGWKPHWERSRAHLAEIADRVRARGVRLAIVYIPGPQSGIHGDCCTELYPTAGGKLPGEDSPLRDWLEEFAAERDLPFVDLHARLLQLQREGDRQPVYDLSNGHLNVRGNGLVADLVYEVLQGWVAR